MNNKVLLRSAAILLLLVAVSTIFVSSAYAGPDGPGTPPPPQPKTTPDPSVDDGGDSGDNKKSTSIITQIFKVIFDTSTMKDAIVGSLGDIFKDASSDLSNDKLHFFQMGSEVSGFVFGIEEPGEEKYYPLKDVRKTSWVQLRKVAFALLPLVAALTIWASMKDGLYNVTGYANTYEAVAEFFVSIAIALASYWLMEQAISLVLTLTEAISDSLKPDFTASVFAGLTLKPAAAAITSPIMSMIFYIFAFALMLTYMGSVVIAFLAREVVIVMTVAMAPVMIILGSVRPLSWLRGMWFKAFIVFLLLLPINVLTMGVSYELYISAMSLMSGLVQTIFQLLIITGTISVLIAVNGTLGKLVYGAAIEVAQKVGESLAAVGKLAVAAGSLAVGLAGGLGPLLGGTGAVAETAPVLAGDGGTGGTMALANTSGGAVTSTSKLTSTIGNVLSSSSNGVLRAAGAGLKTGNAIRDAKMASAAGPPIEPSPQLNIGKNGVPGFDKGLEDAKTQIDTQQKTRAMGIDYETAPAGMELGAETGGATVLAAEEAGLSANDFYRDAGTLTEAQPDSVIAGRKHIRQSASAHLGANSMFPQADLPKWTPRTQSAVNLDFVVAERIVLNDQKFPTSSFKEGVNSKDIGKVARAVQARRVNGGSYNSIISSAERDSNLQDWVNTTKGLQI
jgi:hypothetical protein